MVNRVGQDQTAPKGGVWSLPTLLVHPTYGKYGIQLFVAAICIIFIPCYIMVSRWTSVCLSVHPYVRQSYICPSLHLCFVLHDNLSKLQWIFTKLGMCIDIVEIGFPIANGQIMSNFDGYLPKTHTYFLLRKGWSGGAKVSCILCHLGVQLILAYSWARPAILVAGKGREVIYFFCFFTFIPVPLSSLSLSFISSAISSVSFLPFSGRRHKMTHKGWRVVKPQHNQFLLRRITCVNIKVF